MIKSVARTISTRNGVARIAIRRPLARSETMSVLSSRPFDFESKLRPLPSLSFHSRQFSSSPSQQELLDVVGRELAEEEESESTTMPDDLLSLKEQLAADWSFVEDEGTVRMIRKGGVAKVAVVFHCQDTLEDPGYDGSVEEEENQEIEASPAVRFTLTVSKAGKTMVFKCLSEEATAVVESMAVTMEDLETIHSTGAVDDKYYQVSICTIDRSINGQATNHHGDHHVHISSLIILVSSLRRVRNSLNSRKTFRMLSLPTFERNVVSTRTLPPLSPCTPILRSRIRTLTG